MRITYVKNSLRNYKFIFINVFISISWVFLEQKHLCNILYIIFIYQMENIKNALPESAGSKHLFNMVCIFLTFTEMIFKEYLVYSSL